MAGVYVFNFDDVDFDTTGLVGDLQPIECTFHEEKNGESNLTLTLCYDELRKWAAVKVGSYIKAQVPVRVPPKITDNAYDHEIMTWRVKSNIEKETTVWVSAGTVRERDADGTKALFYNIAAAGGGVQKEVKRKKYLRAGSEVQVLEQHSDGRVKVYSPKFGTGWTLDSNLEQVATSTIPATFAGVESVVTPTRLQYQLFQVTSVEQTLDGVSVTAQHVFYELLHTVTNYKAKYPVEAFSAINGIFDGMVTADERFTCLTDASHKAGALDYERVNMVQALLDPENGICAQYGLSLIRDNYDLYALKNVGSDRGFVVEYGKNMLSVERTEDISNVVTRIIPFGKDKKGNMVFMDGCIYADSAHVDEYAFPRTMYLDCSDTATVSDTMTLAQVKAELKARAEAEFAAGCDLPELTMTVDFISLGDTEEFKQYRNLDKVYLFDRITVKDKVRGYDYNAEVVAITHNVLTGQLESVTLGSIQKGTGIRKIATWQVPEVDGANIRLQSIAAGVLAGGAVGEDNLQDGSVDTRAIAAYSVTTEKLAAGSVTADKIAAGAISADFIEAGSITADKLAAGSVTAEKLAAGAISSDFIEAGSITADKMAAGTITAESGIIAAGAVGTAQIADGSITSAKIVELNADVIKSGTLSTERLLIKGTDGIIYEINAQSSGLTAAELTKEQYKNQLNGTVIVAESITAAQLAANAVTANKILAGAITTDKLSASAVTADKIAAGAITTNKVSSDFGSSLDLSSNKSINAIVSDLTQTFVQFNQPSGTFNVGDVWVRTQASQLWSTLKVKTWNDIKGKAWGEWGYTAQPLTYVWNGEKWVLTVDYNMVQDNQTTITQTQKEISLKANQTTVDALSGRVTQNSTEIRQTAEGIALKADKSELDALSGKVTQQSTAIEQNAQQIALKANKTDPAGSVQTSTVNVNANGVSIATGGTFTVDSQKFDIDGNGEMSAVNARISGQLSVDGHDVWHKGNIIVSTATPGNPTPGTIWVKPDMTGIPAAGTWSHEALPSRPWSNNYVVELSGTSIGAAPNGATYTYEVSVPVYYSHGKTGTCTCTVYLGATSGAKTISMGAQSFDANNAGGNTYKATVTSTTWLGNSGKIFLLVVFSNGNLMTVNSYEAFACTLMAKSTSATGWKACEVQMYVG